MALEPATMDPLEGPYNLDELRMWVSDTRKIASGKSFQVVRLGDLFDELLFGNAEKFQPLVGNILDAKKQYRFRADLTDDLSISVINLPNGKMIMGIINPVKKDAKFLIDGHQVVLDPVKPTMVIGFQYKDDLDNTGRGLFIASQASDTIEPPKVLTEPQSGTYLEGDVADVIATAIGYKDVIAIRNGDVLDGIKAAALPVNISADTADIYVFGFVHPKDPNIITWTKPASIKKGEAEPAQIVSQSQSFEADAGSEARLFADVIGTPPPLVKWVEKINGVNGPVVATGREFTTKVLNTRTFFPIAVNRYKVGADGKFNPSGELKDFPDEGSPVTVTKVGLPQAAPTNPVTNNADHTYGWTDAPGKTFINALISIAGSAFIPATNNPHPVGDRDLANGTVLVKYGETDTYNESATLTNTQPFVASINSNYTLKKGKNLRTYTDNPSFCDDVAPFDATKDKGKMMLVTGGVNVNKGWFLITDTGSAEDKVFITVKAYDVENGATTISKDGQAVQNVEYTIFYGIFDGGGVRGTGLVAFHDDRTYQYDNSSPATGVQEGDTITVKAAFQGVTQELDYTVDAIAEQNQAGLVFKLMKLIPKGHSTLLSSVIVMGVWRKKS